MFVLYTWKPAHLHGPYGKPTYPILGMFNTFDDAAGYAHNVCGFATSAEFFINYEEGATLDYVAFAERNEVATFATSPNGSVVACSFKSKRRS